MKKLIVVYILLCCTCGLFSNGLGYFAPLTTIDNIAPDRSGDRRGATTINYQLAPPTRANLKQHSTGNGQQLYYHSNTNDLVFYGTNKWAVNFIVNELISFPPTDSVYARFWINEINIYVPQNAFNVIISLHENAVPQHDVPIAQPGHELFSTTTNLSEGWNSIPLGEERSIFNGWVVLEFTNSIPESGVSASFGDGKYSYYYDAFDNHTGLFRNLGNIGFHADFLFTLVGSFDRPIIILEIHDFQVPMDISFDEPFLPLFTIKNNSTISARDVYFNLTLRNATVINDSIFVATEMLPGEEIYSKNIDFNGMTLPHEYAQYQLALSVGGAVQGEQLLLGRSLASYISVFEQKKEKGLLEVFAISRETITETVLEHVTTKTNPDSLDVLLYFANSIDPLHTWGAYQRHIQYRHQGFQHTYFNGNLGLNNFSDIHFFEKIQKNYNLSLSDKTFLNSYGFDASVDDDIHLDMWVDLVNQKTTMLSIIGDDIIFNAAFVQPINFNNKQIKMMTQYITNGVAGYAVNFPKGDSLTLQMSFPLYNIDLLEDNKLNDLEVFVWVQRKATNTIYYHEFFSLSQVDFPTEIPGTKDTVPSLLLYPNPVAHNDVLNINFINSKEQKDLKISVYNIRGQRLVSRDIIDASVPIRSLNLTTSGIYFLKVSWYEDGKQHNQINKLLIVK